MYTGKSFTDKSEYLSFTKIIYFFLNLMYKEKHYSIHLELDETAFDK